MRFIQLYLADLVLMCLLSARWPAHHNHLRPMIHLDYWLRNWKQLTHSNQPLPHHSPSISANKQSIATPFKVIRDLWIQFANFRLFATSLGPVRICYFNPVFALAHLLGLSAQIWWNQAAFLFLCLTIFISHHHYLHLFWFYISNYLAIVLIMAVYLGLSRILDFWKYCWYQSAQSAINRQIIQAHKAGTLTARMSLLLAKPFWNSIRFQTNHTLYQYFRQLRFPAHQGNSEFTSCIAYYGSDTYSTQPAANPHPLPTLSAHEPASTGAAEFIYPYLICIRVFHSSYWLGHIDCVGFHGCNSKITI